MSPIILSHSKGKGWLAHQETMGVWQLIFEFHCITTMQMYAQFKHQEEEQEVASAHFWVGGSLDLSSMESGPGFLFSKYSFLTSTDFCWFK